MGTNIKSGLKILSLDAGGAQGISQLQILDHVMQRIFRDSGDSPRGVVKCPCEVFDMIGGVGTGGLIAIFLVVLKMTAKEALEEFAKFAVQIYKDVDRNPDKQTEKLKRVVYEILKSHGMDKDRKLIMENEPTPSCRLVIPVMYKNNVGFTCALRNHAIRQEPPTNLTITVAMLATCAITPMFAPISIGKDFATFEYISGDLGLSNPVREVIAGAHHTFGDESTVACLLSIGCGHHGITSVPSTANAAARIDFLEQLAVDSVKVAQDIAGQMRQLTLYHRLSVSYGLEATQSRIWREPELIAAQTAVYLNDLEVAKVVNGCIDAIKMGHGSATLERLMHSGGAEILPVPLPPLTRIYVERKVPMDFMEKALFEPDGTTKSGSKIVVVTGIGGCGKTQLVRKLVEKHQDRFISTFIVDGSSGDSLRRDIVRHVRSINAAHSQDSFDDSMKFLSHHVLDGQRLLVIDNVDDTTLDLSPFIPRWTNGAVIVTSRNVSRGQLSPRDHVQLDVMSLDESIELLERGSGRDWPPSESAREAAAAVATELGCHPIALAQAIGYMSSTGYSSETYITRLRRYREQLLEDPATHQLGMRYLTAFAAFDASYDVLPLDAQKTLHLLSFFHRQRFPLELVTLAGEGGFSADNYLFLPQGKEFEQGKEWLKETFCISGTWTHRKLDSIVMLLRNQSLITIVPSQDMTLLEMHSLVHEWTRFRVPQGRHEYIQAAAIRLLCCGAKENNYRMMPYLSGHVQALSSTWETLHINDAASFGFILSKSGISAHAVRLDERVHGVMKSRYGLGHPHTMTASENLAATYWDMGKYADAEVLHTETLRERKQLLGTEHPDTIKASANLACTYRQLGRYAEAEVLEVVVLREQKRLLGTEHPDTIWASANLALTYRQLGRYAEAEVLEVAVLREQKRLLGTEHPDTIWASANLASTYGQSGRYAEAEVLQVEVLRERKRLQGKDHPDTIHASASLASTYRQLERYAEAEVLEVEVLRERKRLLGTNHPDTINASANLAATYWSMGNYAEAEVLQVQVLRQLKELLGSDHPDTIIAAANLAATYGKMRRYDIAEVLSKEAISLSKSVMGLQHPKTLEMLKYLAFLGA